MGRKFLTMGMDRWTSTNSTLPITMWGPCTTCSWRVVSFWDPTHIVCCKHNISGEGCNYKFSSLSLGVWCVTKFMHHSMHLHFIYNLCQLWGYVINGVWILPTHWVWHLDIIDMFCLWLNIFPSSWNWYHC
jgi:hypothetical protein